MLGGEFEKAVKVGDVLFYRNAVDKAFLSLVLAVNSYIHRKLNVTPRFNSERRELLREYGARGFEGYL